MGAGLDRFYFSLLESLGIELHPTGHVMTSDMAEMAVTLIITLLRNVVTTISMYVLEIGKARVRPYQQLLSARKSVLSN